MEDETKTIELSESEKIYDILIDLEDPDHFKKIRTKVKTEVDQSPNKKPKSVIETKNNQQNINSISNQTPINTKVQNKPSSFQK